MVKELKRKARIAGINYLLLAVTSVFGLVYVPSKIIVAGDTVTTLKNVQSGQDLFTYGLISNLIYLTVFIFLVLSFYSLLKEVNKGQALLMVVFVLVGIPIAFLNELNKVAILLLANYSTMTDEFGAMQKLFLTDLFLGLNEYGNYMVCMFWGLWLIPLGMLIIRSGLIPRTLGYFLIIGALGYIISSFSFLISPEAGRIIFKYATVPSAIAEVLLILWLLIKGIKEKNTGDSLEGKAIKTISV